MQIISVHRWCQVQSTDGADRKGGNHSNEISPLKMQFEHLQRRQIINMFPRVRIFLGPKKVRGLKVAAPSSRPGRGVGAPAPGR